MRGSPLSPLSMSNTSPTGSGNRGTLTSPQRRRILHLLEAIKAKPKQLRDKCEESLLELAESKFGLSRVSPQSGYSFHVVEHPAGHSPESVVVGLRNVVEWFHEHPTSGEQPIFANERQQASLLDATLFETPDDFDMYRSHPVLEPVAVPVPVDTPDAFEAYDENLSEVLIQRDRALAMLEGATIKVTGTYDSKIESGLLIDLADNESSTTQNQADNSSPLHPDLKFFESIPDAVLSTMFSKRRSKVRSFVRQSLSHVSNHKRNSSDSTATGHIRNPDRNSAVYPEVLQSGKRTSQSKTTLIQSVTSFVTVIGPVQERPHAGPPEASGNEVQHITQKHVAVLRHKMGTIHLRERYKLTSPFPSPSLSHMDRAVMHGGNLPAKENQTSRTAPKKAFQRYPSIRSDIFGSGIVKRAVAKINQANTQSANNSLAGISKPQYELYRAPRSGTTSRVRELFEPSAQIKQIGSNNPRNIRPDGLTSTSHEQSSSRILMPTQFHPLQSIVEHTSLGELAPTNQNSASELITQLHTVERESNLRKPRGKLIDNKPYRPIGYTEPGSSPALQISFDQSIIAPEAIQTTSTESVPLPESPTPAIPSATPAVEDVKATSTTEVARQDREVVSSFRWSRFSNQGFEDPAIEFSERQRALRRKNKTSLL